jgi:ribosomal protein S21
MARVGSFTFSLTCTIPSRTFLLVAIYAVRRGSESNDRLMNRFKKQVQSARFMKNLRELSRYRKKPTRRMTRLKALKREAFRQKNKKQKFYSNM